jgi:hypothetical protein
MATKTSSTSEAQGLQEQPRASASAGHRVRTTVVRQRVPYPQERGKWPLG